MKTIKETTDWGECVNVEALQNLNSRERAELDYGLRNVPPKTPIWKFTDYLLKLNNEQYVKELSLLTKEEYKQYLKHLTDMEKIFHNIKIKFERKGR